MRRWFGALVAVTVLGQAVFNGGRVLLSWRVLDFGGDAATIGWFTAAFSLVPLLIAMPVGRLVDSSRAPEVMQSGLISTVVASAVMALSTNLPVLLIGYTALGFAHMTTLIAAQGMVSHLRGSVAGLDSLFAYFTLGISVGQFLGIVVAGLLTAQSDAASVSTTAALWGMAAVGAVALFCGWPIARAYRRFEAAAAASREDGAVVGSAAVKDAVVKDAVVKEAANEKTAQKAAVRSILSRAGMPAAMSVSIAVIVAIDLLTAYVPVLGREIGLSVGEVTAILSARSGMAVLSRAAMPTVLRRLDRDRVLLASVALGVVPLLLMPWLTETWMLVVATGICGLAWGFVMPMSMTWVSTLIESGARAQALSVRLMGNRLAQVLLPPVAGVGATLVGTSSIFVGAGVLMGLASVAAWSGTRR